MSATPNELPLLIVEDDPDYAALLETMLSKAAHERTRPARAATLSEALTRLERDGRFAAVLLDLDLPDSDRDETLAELSRFEPLPVIILTGLDDEETAISALRAGAQDYLVKEHLRPALLYKAVSFARERKALERRLYDSQHELRRRNEELAARNRQLTDFAAMARNELSQPLQDIQHSCRLLLQLHQDNGDPLIQRQLRDAILMSQQSAEMLENLSNFGLQLTSSQTPEPIDLAELLRSLPRPEHDGAPTDQPQLDGPLPTLSASREELERLLIPLLRLGASSGAPPRLRLVGENERFWEFCVSGARAAEAAGNRRQLLDAFRRVFAYNTSLTLLICQKIVAARGGEIWAEVSPGQNLSIHFQWPKPPAGSS